MCTYTHTHIEKRLFYIHTQKRVTCAHTYMYIRLIQKWKVWGAKGGRRVCVPAKDGTGITIIETSRRKGNMVLCILSVAALCHDVLLLHVVIIAASASASCSCWWWSSCCFDLTTVPAFLDCPHFISPPLLNTQQQQLKLIAESMISKLWELKLFVFGEF